MESNIFNSSSSFIAFKTSKIETTCKATGRWTREEHQKFLDGVKKHGRNWKLVEEYIGTRDSAQIRSHAQKYFNRLEREFQFQIPKSQNAQELNKGSKRKYSDNSVSTYCSSFDTHSENNDIDSSLLQEISPYKIFDFNSNSYFVSMVSCKNYQNSNDTKLGDLVQISAMKNNSNSINQSKSFQLGEKWVSNPSVLKNLNALRKSSLEEEKCVKKIKIN